MSAEHLLARLKGVKSAGRNRWRARCPGHDGDNPTSLAIYEADDGRILLHCHAHGCGVRQILDALGMRVEELFPPRLAHSNGSGNTNPRSAPIQRPWRVGDVVRLLGNELRIAYVILGAVAHNRPISDIDRARAGEAQRHIERFMQELSHAA